MILYKIICLVGLAVAFIRQLLCKHPHTVYTERPRGRGWWHCVTCLRCGKQW